EQSAASALNSGVAEVSYPDPLTVEAGSLENDLRQQEFRIIIQALKSERGRRNKAAEQLGISPRTLRYKLAQMREAGIDLDAELAMA
ncbi:MAG: helix-turn-helix domain-containing protein, partial [Marinobacter sp.]